MSKEEVWIKELDFNLYDFFHTPSIKFEVQIFLLTIDVEPEICMLWGSTKYTKADCNTSLWLKVKIKKNNSAEKSRRYDIFLKKSYDSLILILLVLNLHQTKVNGVASQCTVTWG